MVEDERGPEEPDLPSALQSSTPPPVPDETLYKAYEGHATTLRAWLVAYGVGGPVLLLTNERISSVIADAGHARLLAVLFLAGVSLQVILAALNKYAMWLCYYSDEEPQVEEKWPYNWATWVSRQVWIDLAVDLASLGVFGYATYRILVDVAAAT
ncbi:MAG: hypothetical protein WEB06_09305 [Actinomycetota bacterium]